LSPFVVGLAENLALLDKAAGAAGQRNATSRARQAIFMPHGVADFQQSFVKNLQATSGTAMVSRRASVNFGAWV